MAQFGSSQMPRRLSDSNHKQDAPHTVLRVTVVSRLKQALEKRGLTQTEAARRINVSGKHVHRLAQGDIPRLDTAFLLEKLLDTPIHELFVPTFKTMTLR